MAGWVFRSIVVAGVALALLGVLKIFDFLMLIIGGYLIVKYLEF
jgi:hypothetical protein